MHFITLGVLLLAGIMASSPAAQGRPASVGAPDSTLVGLTRMIGTWRPASQASRRTPPNAARWVVHDYSWTVQGKALRIRENYQVGRADGAEVDGLVYWNPATERIEFVAVGGPGPGQGRFFSGEYRILADSAVERIYDVFYRTLADTPGEELGGARRRYREVYRTVTPDSIEATLDWWQAGRWQPFGPGRYGVVRIAG